MNSHPDEDTNLSDKCQECRQAVTPGQIHTCPLKLSINPDDQIKCNCCDDCTALCKSEI